MFRLILISTTVLLSFATSLFAQQEMPAELALKLTEKAEKLFPNNPRAQDKWLNQQNENYILVPMLQAPIGNEEIFNKYIKPMADKKFELDFTAKAKFIQDMSEGLVLIDAYKNAYGENTALFEKMKQEVIKANPENFKKAATEFEAKSQAMIEIDSLPRNEMVDDALFYGLKAAANKKFPNDYTNQKAYLEKILNVFVQYEILQANTQIQETKKEETSDTPFEIQKNTQDILMKSQVLVKGENGDGIGIVTLIKDKPVVIFPKSLYDSNAMVIVNTLDEPVAVSDVLAAKNSPFAVAIVKSLPEGMTPIPMAKPEDLKNSIQKNVFLLIIQDNAISLRSNTIVSIKENALNMSRKILNGTTQGSGIFIFDDKGNPQLLGICTKEDKDIAMPDFTNKMQSRYFERAMQNTAEKIKVSRIDEISGWQKIGQTKFSEDMALLKKITDNNKAFFAFFNATNLKDLANYEALNDVVGKYLKLFKEEIQNAPSLEKNIKNMLSETISIMTKDIRKLDIASINPILKSDLEFQLKWREKMIDTLKNVIKKNNFKRFIFDDIQLKR